MASNVIRQDIIEVDVNSNFKELLKLQKEIDSLKKKLGGNMGEDAFDDLKKNADKSNSSLNKVKNTASKVNDNLKKVGKKGAVMAFKGLKKVASISFKALTAGIGAAATAIGGLVVKSVSAYGEYQQLIGGIKTLFGAKEAKNVKEYADLVGKSVDKVKGEYKKLVEVEKTVQTNANDAYKTAGMSANQYMETVTTFASALTNSLGGDTKKGAELANTAIKDMADNANKMGTPLENVSIVYSNIARGMYMTLDNLKLGYAGTKEGAKQLVKDAAKYDKSVNATSLSYANIVKAIHAIQKQKGITGTTEREAAKTITGSLNMVKSAWGNLLPAMAKGGDSLDQCINNFVDSVDIFSKNIMPVVEKSLGGVGTLIEKLTPKITAKIPELTQTLLPPLLKSATSLVAGLIKALPQIVNVLIAEIPNIFKELGTAITSTFGEQYPIIKKFGKGFKSIGDFFKDNATAVKIFIGALAGLPIAFKAFKGIKSIASFFGGIKSKGGLGSLFGDKKSKGGGGLLDGLTKTFTKLAKTKTTTILKGMANLAIIIGGFTLIAVALMALSPYMAQLTDVKSFAKVVGAISVVGIIGTGLAKLGEIAGKIPVSKVAKGLANMAIMIAGTSALFLLLGAISLIKLDIKKILGIALAIGAIGVVGTALSVFAGIVGLIPILTVVKGLANMAIVITGMSALFLLIGAVSLINFDLKRITHITLIIGLLGTLGSALSIFAGIVGLIPISVVLKGIANIALVIGGITALIVAYGKLSSIKGFNDFITAGGDTLANLFNAIGKIGGSLVGGIGEGISNSLPNIGKSLTAFVNSIKPMFTMFKGVDMTGASAFFNALGNFMLKMAGNDLASIFTGGTDLAGLGTELTDFATNSADFFNMVATFPVNGFTNASLLFKSLADISNVPNTGGLAQLFAGNNDFTALADGLSQLSDDSVIAFFNKVSKIPEAGFNNAKSLFKSLSDIGNVPNTGGLTQWFAGENDIAGLAKNLPDFGKSMASFYNSISKIKDFSKISSLFKTLKSISEVPNSGGVAQWFSGENNLAGLGADLKSFAEDAKPFFSQVNKLNVNKLKGMVSGLKSFSNASINIKANVSGNFSKLASKISGSCTKILKTLKATANKIKPTFNINLTSSGVKMMNTLKSGLIIGGKAVISTASSIAKSVGAQLNNLIKGANHTLSQFGSKSKLSTYKYAKGTSGHKGGNALVNDGRGAEMVQMPNGNTFIPRGKNVFIPNAPKGMKVLPAGQTAQLMGRKSPTYNYANGTGDFDVFSYDKGGDLANAIVKKYVNYKGMSGLALSLGKSVVNTTKKAMSTWAGKLIEKYGAKGLGSYNPSKGVAQWRSTVIRALKMEGLYSPANVARTLYQMQTESGGNPRAINLWDSNAKRGIPSKGLMQVIDPTFKSYARAGYNKNIYDPLSNILAAIRYAVSRYGSLARAFKGHGYENGGIATKPSIFGENGNEMAIPLRKNKRKRALNLYAQTGRMLGLSSYTPEQSGNNYTSNSVENNTYAPVFNLTVNGNDSDRAIERKVKRWVKEEMNEVFESLSTHNPKTKEA